MLGVICLVVVCFSFFFFFLKHHDISVSPFEKKQLPLAGGQCKPTGYMDGGINSLLSVALAELRWAHGAIFLRLCLRRGEGIGRRERERERERETERETETELWQLRETNLHE